MVTAERIEKTTLKNLLYNDGYTIRGVQKVIKENGTRNLIGQGLENNTFTLKEKDNITQPENNNIPRHDIAETKKKKLMNVLNNLVQLKDRLDKN